MAIPQVDVQALHCCQTPQEAVTGPELGGLVVVALVAELWLTGQAAALQLSDCELPPEHSPLRDLERVPPPQLTLHVDHWPQAPQGTAQAFELQDSDSLKEVHPPVRDRDRVPPPQVTVHEFHWLQSAQGSGQVPWLQDSVSE